MARVESCDFFRTTAGDSAGGALAVQIAKVAHITGCQFLDNAISGRSGQEWAAPSAGEASGGSILLEQITIQARVHGCTFGNNSAVGSGGAVRARQACSFSVSHSQFRSNYAGVAGGAIAQSLASLEVDCLSDVSAKSYASANARSIWSL